MRVCALNPVIFTSRKFTQRNNLGMRKNLGTKKFVLHRTKIQKKEFMSRDRWDRSCLPEPALKNIPAYKIAFVLGQFASADRLHCSSLFATIGDHKQFVLPGSAYSQANQKEVVSVSLRKGRSSLQTGRILVQHTQENKILYQSPNRRGPSTHHYLTVLQEIQEVSGTFQVSSCDVGKYKVFLNFISQLFRHSFLVARFVYMFYSFLTR